MSFPHTEAVIGDLAALRSNHNGQQIDAAMSLLRQYFKLCTTLESLIEQQRENLASEGQKVDALKEDFSKQLERRLAAANEESNACHRKAVEELNDIIRSKDNQIALLMTYATEMPQLRQKILKDKQAQLAQLQAEISKLS